MSDSEEQVNYDNVFDGPKYVVGQNEELLGMEQSPHAHEMWLSEQREQPQQSLSVFSPPIKKNTNCGGTGSHNKKDGGVEKSQCKICSPQNFCNHGLKGKSRRKNMCPICNPENFCKTCNRYVSKENQSTHKCGVKASSDASGASASTAESSGAFAGMESEGGGSTRKSYRKSARKSSRKSARKSSRKSARKSSRKSARKSSRKSARKI